MIYFGIDVSKKKVDCAWLRDLATGKIKTRVFGNTPQGFQSLLAWACRQSQAATAKHPGAVRRGSARRPGPEGSVHPGVRFGLQAAPGRDQE